MANMHKDSYTITKVKPKIRIIHLFAPEIIKTDAENFRELVQRLTGKTASQKAASKRSRRGGNVPRLIVSKSRMQERVTMTRNEELGIWNAENSGGFLKDFAHLDGYDDVQELVEFPLLPLDASSPSSSSSHSMDAFEAMANTCISIRDPL